MTHKLKMLGLVLVAVCAMDAVVVSGASAASFTTATSTTAIRGVDEGAGRCFRPAPARTTDILSWKWSSSTREYPKLELCY